MKRYDKFWKQSVKIFLRFKIIGAHRCPVDHSIKKKIYIYKNNPVKKMYSKNTRVLECNVVSNFKQSAKNFRIFKILGTPKGPRDTFCLYIF